MASFFIFYFLHPQSSSHFKTKSIYSLIGFLAIDVKYVQGKFKRTWHSQMFWSAIRYGVKGDLIIMPGDPTAKNEGVTAQVYRDVLEEELPTLMNADTIFMHDNAPIYTARKVKRYLQEMAFQVLNWPPYSPDLNPIKNMWKLLKRGIHEKYPKLATLSFSNESF